MSTVSAAHSEGKLTVQATKVEVEGIIVSGEDCGLNPSSGSKGGTQGLQLDRDLVSRKMIQYQAQSTVE